MPADEPLALPLLEGFVQVSAVVRALAIGGGLGIVVARVGVEVRGREAVHLHEHVLFVGEFVERGLALVEGAAEGVDARLAVHPVLHRHAFGEVDTDEEHGGNFGFFLEPDARPHGGEQRNGESEQAQHEDGDHAAASGLRVAEVSPKREQHEQNGNDHECRQPDRIHRPRVRRSRREEQAGVVHGELSICRLRLRDGLTGQRRFLSRPHIRDLKAQ